MNAASSTSLRPKARLVHTLGSELISSEHVALMELIKNAYDADATQIVIRFSGNLVQGDGQIEVWDNGHGMSAQVIRDVWLDIATPYRQNNQRSESGARRVLGEKGIGRLAASRIGRFTEIVTKREDKDEASFNLDWNEFSRDIYLDEIQVEVSEREPLVFAELGESANVFGPAEQYHGTVVRMRQLKQDWTANDISRLRLELSRMVPPRPDESLGEVAHPTHSIRLELPVEFEHLGGQVVATDVLDHPDYSIVGILDSDGTAVLRYSERRSGRTEEFVREFRVSGHEVGTTRPPSCGPLAVDIRVWDLDTEAFKSARSALNIESASVREYRRHIKDHSGIGLFRDGFRVQPFGQASYDWLNLDARRVNNPTLALSNNQISGFIFVTANENEGLRDRSHREGLIDTVEYEDLKEVTLKIVNELEVRRRMSRHKTRQPDARPGGRNGLFDDFKLESLQGLAHGRPDDVTLNEVISETLQEVEAGAARVQEVLMQFSRLATLGTLVDLVLHEGRSALMHVRTSAENVGFCLEDSATLEKSIHESAKNNLTKLDVGVETLSAMFNRLGPMSGRRRGRPRPVSLKLLVDQGLELQRPELGRLKIALEVDVSDETVTVDPSEIFQILINLVGNSAYWVTQTENDSRKIKVYAHRDDAGNIIIGVNDNGPGILEEERERVFDEYFTRRVDGTGLGLSIVRTLVHDFYDGTALVVDGGELPGAHVQVTLRKRIK